MLARPAHLPNALVGLAPDVLEVGEKLDLGTPSRFVGRQSAAPRLMMHVHDLPEHVGLQLGVRCVPTHTGTEFWSPGSQWRPIGQPSLAADAIHNMELVALLRLHATATRAKPAPLVIARVHRASSVSVASRNQQNR